MSQPETTPGAEVSPLERRNERTLGIDRLPTLEILRLLNAEDHQVAGAVERALAQLTNLVDEAYAAIAGGGKVHYFGAGTSGRLAVLDAAELKPTFESTDLVTAHLAGGPTAMFVANEAAEDDPATGAADASQVGPLDLAIGISASGTTPYVAGALSAARRRGAATAIITCNPFSPILANVDLAIVLDTGPEAVTGSTRLKAGTAQKMALNSFSTALMVRLGRTWSNLMVSLTPNNQKLRRRALAVLEAVTGEDATAAAEVLDRCGGDLRIAVVHRLSGASPEQSRVALHSSGGSVRDAVELLTSTPASDEHGGGS